MKSDDNEPRKIVLILGNGFDLDLGLKTSYKDYWKSSYCPKDYPSPLIRHLNNRWDKDIDKVRWYDLENELLTYVKEGDKTDIINDEERSYLKRYSDHDLYIKRQYSDLDDYYSSLVQKGILFLGGGFWVHTNYRNDLMESVLWRDKKAFRLIKEGLCAYLKTAEMTIQRMDSVPALIILAMIKSAKAGDLVDIFSFNYTQVQTFGHRLQNINTHYMHGSCDNNNIIIGTRDDLSIPAGYDFVQKVMDDSFSPPDIVSALKEADELIIFGHSLGENDRQYFAPFFKKQANYDDPIRKDITIITRDHQSQFEIKQALQKMTEGNLSALYSINQPNIIKTANIDEDQHLLFDFLIKHHTHEEHAEVIVESLLQKKYN